MFPKQNTKMQHCVTSLHKQQGSMLVMSLFIIIVLAMLGATMAQITMASNRAVITDMSGLHARNAAQVGLELLGQQSFPLNNPIAVCATTVSQPAGFTNIPGFGNCRFTASCTTESIWKGPQEHYYYRFSSTGECDVGNTIVSRTLSVDALESR
jgi:MSHA biogenesis protein MshP